MPFGAVVKTVRDMLGLIQEQLARELNVSFSTVNRWEHEKSRPSQMAKELFRQFCDSRGINLSILEKGGSVND